MDVLALLKEDHKAVGALLDEAQGCEPDDDRIHDLATEIERALTVHATLEEKFFYPELRKRAEETEDTVDVFEAYTEHDVLKHLIALLQSGRQADEKFKAELQVLGENVKHHVKEEESTIFSLARQLMDRDELDELGAKMEKAKQRLMAGTPSNGRAGAARKTAKKTPARKAASKKAGTRR